MDLRAIAAGFSPARAFQLEHPVLPRFAVMCAKLIGALWLVTGQIVYFRDTFLPFVGTAAFAATDFRLLQSVLVLAQLTAAFTIVCSRFVRTGCAMLAAIIAALALLDQPLFSNNRAFCAALLAMIALGDARFARCQVALVYAAAALDKLLNADWRSGWFLETFAASLASVHSLSAFDGAPRPLRGPPIWLYGRLDAHPGLAQLLSALVIGTELAIALGYIRSWRATIALVIALHGAILYVTGSTFGIFFYACIAASLLVLDQRAASART